MANAFYPSGRLAIADQSVDLITDTLKVVACTSTYTYSSTHSVHADLSGIVGTATALAGKTWALDAIFDADDISYPDVAAATIVTRLVFFVDTGVSASSPLICYMDQEDDGTPINITGTGAPIPILWDNGAFKIFRL
jgi:hypothetical protein